ncbi:type IV secretory system conjugative DNA transfer family protein [Streptomyces sp. NPDC057428]|uniref:type IV secretory system conjugative DNA transfer family protein n=1 Tax=Streptomyces sp. NPDC057428 TaxID=3346129 RepID=UPI0036C12076
MARQSPSGTGRGEQQGGIPDGLLIGLLAFLFGLTVLAWTATGLAGLFTHGAWPHAVTFTRTPLALRALAVQPTDLPGAWPDTPAGELSGHGLFWGLFIGEVMVLLVLTVFAAGVVTRWRMVRKRRVSHLEPAPKAVHPQSAVHEYGRAGTRSLGPPAPAPPPVAAPPAAAYAPETPPAAVPTPRTPHVMYGVSATRRPTAVQAIRDADGPALVVTSDPTVWAETKDARSKLGPVLVYDPGHLCDTPARLHWSPTAGCEDPAVAAARATALLTPVRPLAKADAAVADTAATLLQCWLHAAAVDGRPFRQVHRWASGAGGHEVVRLLRTHPKAASGLAGLLESALTAYPERREMAQELTVRAFAALSSVHIREACTANRADALVLESFARELGTLYVVGEPIEDPRHHPGAMPLLTALTSHVVEHGRRMAARSTDGRLDPPMSLVLDDVAAVAPLPQLPELLAAGQDHGMPALALLRSREQARARWQEELPAPGTR